MTKKKHQHEWQFIKMGDREHGFREFEGKFMGYAEEEYDYTYAYFWCNCGKAKKVMVVEEEND